MKNLGPRSLQAGYQKAEWSLQLVLVGWIASAAAFVLGLWLLHAGRVVTGLP